MNDFETARKLACQVEDPAGPSLPCGECAGCLALDRIETVVERLRKENKDLLAVIQLNQNQAEEWDAEVKQLTKEKEDLRKAYEVVWDNSAEDRAEVERLRGIEQENEARLRLEVERLRAALGQIAGLNTAVRGSLAQDIARAALAKEEA